ncbi:hypothetical protein LTR37_002889 [Vermiconidia calcicola]|uniref:Uncharacterized protein n=1 Tax=Vermiconidia calcicola TaxID=1690605 RepID=A0ACC3NRI9_9PEZI|nr:hypothetical protein LTR37_002889 [Vermiconidia calcicola]
MASSTGAAHFFAQTSKCLSDPVFADFTIIAADKEYKVNRMLLACHSEYFKKAFETKFKGSDQSFIDLKGENPNALSHAITYFYTLCYDGEKALTTKDHVNVYLLADRYDIPGLSELALERFSASTTAYDEDVTGFFEVIQGVYENTTAVNKDIRSATINYWLMMSFNKLGTDRSSLVQKLIEVPQFMSELILTYEKGHNGNRKTFYFECQHCRKSERRTVPAPDLKMADINSWTCPNCRKMLKGSINELTTEGKLVLKPRWRDE